jgi:hypothetical protein
MTTLTHVRAVAEQEARKRKGKAVVLKSSSKALEIHQPRRIDCTFGVYTFHAYCGHVSTNKNEFRKEKWGLDKVTCAACLVRVRGGRG